MVNVAVLFASTACAAQDVLNGSRWEHSDEADEYLRFRIDAMVLRAEIPARSLRRGRPWRKAQPARDQRT